MTFKELLKTVTFDDVWTELDKEYSLKDEAFEAYLRVFNQLEELTPEPNHDGFRLAVVKVEDEFKPGKFVYDVFGIKSEDKEHYALEMLPWKEWLSLIVVEKCTETYGSATVVAHSLYELTFFGYDAVDVEAGIEKEFEILKERQEEIENDTAKYVSWDELCKELGYVDDLTEEEKELERKQFKRIMAENKRVYEMLLS
ncbi:DUF6557 family protein [Desulfoscipio gibsoniae]|uniref:Uncharacterized protein n=1 Tax=Desulfoscipio gibsoniae DSM 7213 TaxID=767817 RepID=R4KDC6_9FIRM|nr:DUF6557 family protein [Desulfoscipio gibsoniae]AGL01193.1 hypothetical protein Desgi_1732 [Desulfoscipio gibsoniae DSM 7213]